MLQIFQIYFGLVNIKKKSYLKQKMQLNVKIT